MRLKEIREEIGISQKELAKKLKVSPTNVYNYENGRTEPSIDMLINIAEILNVSIDYLVGKVNEAEINEHYPTKSDLQKTELLKVFSKLDCSDKNKVIGYATALADK